MTPRRPTIDMIRNARLSPGITEGGWGDKGMKDDSDDGYAGTYEPPPPPPPAAPRMVHLARVLTDANNARLDHAHKYLGQVSDHIERGGPAPKKLDDDFVPDTHKYLAAAGISLAHAVQGANDEAKHRDLDDVHRHLSALHAHLQHQYGMFNAEGLEKGAKP